MEYGNERKVERSGLTAAKQTTCVQKENKNLAFTIKEVNNNHCVNSMFIERQLAIILF